MSRLALLRKMRSLGGEIEASTEAAEALLTAAVKTGVHERNSQITQAVSSWHTTRDQVKRAAVRLANDHPPAFDAWGSPRWNGYRPREGTLLPPFGLPIGHLADGGALVDDLLYNGLSATPDELAVLRSLDATLPKLPLAAPFSPSGSFTIITSYTDRGYEQAVRATQSLMWRMVGVASPDYLKFDLIDTHALGAATQDLLQLPLAIRSAKVAVSEEEVRDLLLALQTQTRDVLTEAAAHKHNDLWQYNAANPSVAIPFRLLVAFGYPAGFSHQSLALLQTLMGAAPPAGIGAVLVTPPGASFPHGVIPPAAGALQITEASPGRWMAWTGHGGIGCDLADLPPSALKSAFVREIEKELASTANKPITKPSAPTGRWTGSAIRELEVEVGRYANQDPLVIRIDSEQLPHMMVGGKSGWGKSVFLHNIVAGLAERYGPDELTLVLVDLKNGVEFQVYDRLPHARVVVNKNDSRWAMAAISLLQRILKERSDRFTRVGGAISNYEEYRRARPNEALPRIVCVIDEVQNILRASPYAAEAGAAITKIAKEGRSYGVHLLLATQSWTGGYVALDDIRNQVATRAALHLDDVPESAAVLGRNNGAAAGLTKPGDIAVTTNPSDTAQTRTGRVYQIDKDDVRKRTQALAQLAGQRGVAPQMRYLVNSTSVLEWPELAPAFLRARRSGTRDIGLLAGRPFNFEPDVAAVLTRGPDENLLIHGPDEQIALSLLNSAVISALGTRAATVQVLAPGPLPANEAWSPLLHLGRALANTSAFQLVQEPSLSRLRLDDALGEIAEREGDAPDALEQRTSRLIVVPLLEQWARSRAVDPAEFADRLQEVARRGPSVGVHLAVQSLGYLTFEALFSYGADQALKHFGHVLVSKGEHDNLRSACGLSAQTEIGADEAVYVQRQLGYGQSVWIEPYRYAPSFDLMAAIKQLGSA